MQPSEWGDTGPGLLTGYAVVPCNLETSTAWSPSFDQASWCPVFPVGYALWGQEELNVLEELILH